jgi:hypothetical protein
LGIILGTVLSPRFLPDLREKQLAENRPQEQGENRPQEIQEILLIASAKYGILCAMNC